MSVEQHAGACGTIRVAQMIPWFAADAWGGTEQYVHSLVSDLRSLGVDASVVVPVAGNDWTRAFHDGVEVLGMPHAGGQDSALRGMVHLSSLGFTILHLHGWTPRAGLVELDAARSAGLSTALTLHVPSLLCARGTMLKHGVAPCDGVVAPARCAECWLRSQRVPARLAGPLSRIPPRASARLAHALGRLRARHLVGAPAMIADRRRDIRAASAAAQRIVAPCLWLHDALLANGIDATQLLLSRQGVSSEWRKALESCPGRRAEGILQVAFVGRWDTVKGLDTLMQAFRSLPHERSIRLAIAAPRATGVESQRARKLALELVGTDSRISIHEGQTRDQLAALIRTSQVLAVPSRCLETGPLVVLEGLAAGCFVLGSDLGGIRELLCADEHAELVPCDDVAEWSAALARLARRASSLALAIESRSVRTGVDVAHDMAQMYQSLRAPVRSA